jgi:uncharacterized cupredoxin-like copper-binding protein
MNGSTAETGMMALLGGFIVSAGLVSFTIAAGGYQPFPARVGPAAVAAPAPAAAAQAPAQAVAPTASKVIATDLKFNPPTLKAKVGQPIEIVLENKGVIEHDIAFPTLKADKPGGALQVLAKPGQTATLEFTPTAAGKFEYICTIPGHKEAGMKGTIDVAQ